MTSSTHFQESLEQFRIHTVLHKIICRDDLNVLFDALSSVTNTPRHK
ncbi:hypothetical protein UUU_43980 [Klebsiella pneumoniae subsp. pneumoniae DSM 30104 = JCM 1662 = NBRC 14940]|nr:hypothetical protein UUU_43980 [Klebsiella pneumoniae subsp. pneumoniae DSM 30104 = JCM 1662 = NBRC 14940]